jgi:predicted nucleotidyltransferase
MKTVEEIKRVLVAYKEELRTRYGVKKIGIFGSYARNEQSEISDIDLLVEFEKPIGLKFVELAEYLEGILGIRVELVTPNALKQKPRLWESVKEDLIYA